MPIMPLITKASPSFACLSRFNGSCPHAKDPAAPSAQLLLRERCDRRPRHCWDSPVSQMCPVLQPSDALPEHQEQGQSCGESQSGGTTSAWQLRSPVMSAGWRRAALKGAQFGHGASGSAGDGSDWTWLGHPWRPTKCSQTSLEQSHQPMNP